MTASKGLAALAVLVFLSACGGVGGVSAPPNPFAPDPEPAAPVAETLTELGPQTLADGACGTFFWGMAEPNPFLVFVNESQGLASVFSDGQAHDFTVARRPAPLVVGDAYDRRFQDAARGLDFHLTGTASQIVADGLRVERSVIRRRLPDGAQRVTPLVGVFTCRDGA